MENISGYLKNQFFRGFFCFLVFFFLTPSCAVMVDLGKELSKELEKEKFKPIVDAAKEETLNYANQIIAQQIAKTFQFDPLLNVSRGDRTLSYSQRNNASAAYQMFLSPPSAVEFGGSYQNARQRVEAVIRHYDVLTDSDIFAIEQAFSPFLDIIQREIENPTPSGVIAVYPNEKRTVRFQGYCLDKGISTPRTKEAFQLVPVSQLLPNDTAPYYRGLLQYGQSIGNYNEVQGLMWRLVHGVNPEHEPSSFNSRQTQILNEAVSGGANGFQSYLQGRYDYSQNSLQALYQSYGREEVQKFIDKHLNPFFGRSGIEVDMYRQDLNSSAEVGDYLHRLSQIPVEGQTELHSQYTLLNDQVAARSISTNGIREMTVEFLNTSDEVFYYDPAQYMGFSTRRTQPVGHYPKEEEEIDPSALASIELVLKFFSENPEILEYAGYTLDAFLIGSGAGIGVFALKNAAKAILRNPKKLKELWEAFYKSIKKPQIPALRKAYVKEVKGLSKIADKMRASGKYSEEIARLLHAERRKLGLKYKDMTSPDKLAIIYERNLRKYGDKLGPSIEFFRRKGKSWDDIIESATRTGGADLGF